MLACTSTRRAQAVGGAVHRRPPFTPPSVAVRRLEPQQLSGPQLPRPALEGGLATKDLPLAPPTPGRGGTTGTKRGSEARRQAGEGGPADRDTQGGGTRAMHGLALVSCPRRRAAAGRDSEQALGGVATPAGGCLRCSQHERAHPCLPGALGDDDGRGDGVPSRHWRLRHSHTLARARTHTRSRTRAKGLIAKNRISCVPT